MGLKTGYLKTAADDHCRFQEVRRPVVKVLVGTPNGIKSYRVDRALDCRKGRR